MNPKKKIFETIQPGAETAFSESRILIDWVS
jgi:hypothetical protein